MTRQFPFSFSTLVFESMILVLQSTHPALRERGGDREVEVEVEVLPLQVVMRSWISSDCPHFVPPP